MDSINSISIKSYMGENIRRFSVPNDITLEGFREILSQFYVGIENLVTLYKDDEGDFVSFSCEEEWEEAKVCRERESVFRIYFCDPNKKKKQKRFDRPCFGIGGKFNAFMDKMKSAPFRFHYGVQCKGCNLNDFCGNRYKCNSCENFDLCHKCFERRKEIHPHDDFQVFEIPKYIGCCGMGKKREQFERKMEKIMMKESNRMKRDQERIMRQGEKQLRQEEKRIRMEEKELRRMEKEEKRIRKQEEKTKRMEEKRKKKEEKDGK